MLAGVVAELHLRDAVLPRFFDQQFEGAAPVPLALLAGVDHEAPHPELLRRVAVRHDESHGLVVGIDGPKPRPWLEVSLGDGASVRSDVLLLLGLDREIEQRR